MGIRRAKRDRWIAGVCGGIAHTYGYKPWVVRLVFVLLALLLPSVGLLVDIAVYALLAFLLPESDQF
jgi:phage shock protein C